MEVRKVIESVVVEALSGVRLIECNASLLLTQACSYSPEEKIVELTKKLSNLIKNKIKEGQLTQCSPQLRKHVFTTSLVDRVGAAEIQVCRASGDSRTKRPGDQVSEP